MKCRILHESKRRIRLGLIQKRMSLMEADMLFYYLEAEEYITYVKVYDRTADVEVRYKEGKRKEALQAIARFSYEDPTLSGLVPETTTRSLNKKYYDKLVLMVVGKLARDMFLPMPIRVAYIMVSAIPFILKGLRCILKRKMRVELLDALSIMISILRRDFNTVSSVMFLLKIGVLLEEWTHKKSVQDLARSMALHVDKVWLKTDGADILIPVSKLCAEDLVRVHTGSVIPIDGVVAQGEAMVNQASLTGESIPMAKREGSTVYAGTVVEEGEFLIRVKAASGQGRYDKIVSMIEESEKLKSNTEAKFSSIADRLVPYSFLGMGITYLFTRNILRSISVIMVDFSCALKLAMPLSVLSAMREAGSHNITVKGGKFLEKIAEADTIVFDKTGTLTYACPKVARVIACAGEDEKEMLRLSACLEEHFPHSMANAVVQKAYELGLEHEELHTEVEYIVAHGIASTIDGKRVIIGSHHFIFEDEQVRVAPEDIKIVENLDPSYSHLYLAIGGKLSAIIYIHDPLRKESREVLRALKELGIQKTVMMTGDSYYTAEAIAKEVGVDEFYAKVLPEDKAGFIEQERKKGRKVIMVGDGINDSPALSAADCGIAIAEGAAIARQIADITILGDNLKDLVQLKYIANALMKRVRKNYYFIMGFNGSLIALGVMGIISPTTSALLHNASTLGVSMRSMTDLIGKGSKLVEAM